MSKEYNPKDIETRWQDEWEKAGLYRAENDSRKPKYYALVEFPYPSGDGLHVGHPRPYIGLDIIARKRRMEGFNVLYPIGWDAFGLPTENYAIKTGKNPKVVTKENSDTFRRQIQSLGISFDWSREINTTDPKYYKWTQWIFLKFLEKGLAYKAKIPINWCPKDKIGLANEEVVDGKCERCSTLVEQKEKEQWMLAITKYAERLDKDLDDVDYPERVKIQQRNWIGRSEGAEISFEIKNNDEKIKVFTTRPDTIFGATYMVLAPEHSFVANNLQLTTNKDEIVRYIEQTKAKTDIDRSAEGKEKTGVELKGVKVINPATTQEIPVYIAEYVMSDYGTGAIMAVPAHDERDWEFAKKHDLPIKEVVIPKVIDKNDPPREGAKTVFRNAIQAIVIDPKTQKVLCLKWKKLPWTTFITGGIDEGEDIIEAAKREILEETGYKNIKYIKTMGGPVESHFFANHKDENRKAMFTALHFELENDERIEVPEEEKAIHEAMWVTWEELKADKNTKCAEYDMWLDRLFNEPHAWVDEGVLFDSGEFTGLTSQEAREKITEKFGKTIIKYKLRDWVFSRQRYWGEPIPVVHCKKCGVVPVPEKDLPVELPVVEKYEPGPDGESPLANIAEWVNVACPKCGGEAKRETDVMPNWAGSSWYFLRYCDHENEKEFASMKKLKYWMGVDWYNGGMEHTVLHLLYSRFWNKFLYDLKLVSTSEPYKKRTSHGLILAEGGEKMSKSKGNVINPDTIVERFGADTLRLYEMFMGPFEQAIAWSEASLVGPRRFLEKVWRLQSKVSKGQTLSTDSQGLTLVHQTIKKVSEDIKSMGFNTAVSTLMIYANTLDKQEKVSQKEFETLLFLLAPFAPHITEELWRTLGHPNSIHTENWPTYDQKKIEKDEITLAVQVNGKVRASLSVSRSQSEEEIRVAVLSLLEVKKWLNGKEPKRVIIVPGRIVSIVT